MPTLMEQLQAYERDFEERNEFHLSFERECHFAKQLLVANDYTLKVARNNEASLRNAILNVAAIGISLNPAEKLAYLVPRDSAVMLDISYRGLMRLAIDSGAITKCKVELVYEQDQFEWHDMYTMPTHRFDPFDASHSGDDPFPGLRGGYCAATLPDGSVIVGHMGLQAIMKVRNASKTLSGNAAKYSPWTHWPRQMIEKAIVRQEAKWWPAGSGRMAKAVDVLNDYDGDARIEEQSAPQPAPTELDTVRQKLGPAGLTEEELCRMAGIESLELIQPQRITPMLAFLDNRIAQRNQAA